MGRYFSKFFRHSERSEESNPDEILRRAIALLRMTQAVTLATFITFLTLTPSAIAANITATLDDAAGSSVFAVNDSASILLIRKNLIGEWNVGESMLEESKKDGGQYADDRDELTDRINKHTANHLCFESFQTELETRGVFDHIISDAASVCGFDGQNNTRNQQWQSMLSKRLSFPLFFSFLFQQYNTDQKQYKGQYAASNPQKQGHIFKKIAGKSDRCNRLAQIAKIFGNKFLGVFIEDNTHDDLLLSSSC